jgi:MFS family permease
VGTERVSYRWWVLVNTFLIFTIAFGMGWTYIVMLVSPILQELGLNLADWGTLWSAISFGTVLFAIIGGVLGDRFGIRLTVGLGVFFMGGFLDGIPGLVISLFTGFVVFLNYAKVWGMQLRDSATIVIDK